MEALLCIKIASRGDLLLAGPAFRRLRQLRPQAHLTLLVGRSCADVALHLPYFDEVRTLDDHALFAGGRRERLRAARELFRALRTANPPQGGRAGRFSEVFIFHRDWRYGLLARLAGIPVRRGFASPRGSRFLTHAYAVGGREHHVGQYLGMIGSAALLSDPPPLAGVWRFQDGEREAALRRAVAAGFHGGEGPWVGLAFGGGRNVKNRTDLKAWPLAQYRRLAAGLTGRGYRVVWLGDRSDGERLGEAGIGLDLAGKLSVAESAAVLGECALVVANDSLLLHLAEALGVPTVGLFGPTDPALYGPLGASSAHLWGGRALACSPCEREGTFPSCGFGHRCLRELPVEAVLQTIESRLSDGSLQPV